MSNGHQTLLEGRDKDGIPLKSDYDGMAPSPKSLFVLYTKFFFVFVIFGVIVGAVVLYCVKPQATITKVSLVSEYGLGPLFIGLFILKYCFQMINANMGTARRETKVNNPDQHIYRVYGGPANGSVVLMDCEGDYGKFNRAQRALANLEEWLPIFLAEMILVGFVFPLCVAIITTGFGLARLKGAIGYTKSPKDRTGGNMLGFLMGGLLDGLCLFVGVVATYQEYA